MGIRYNWNWFRISPACGAG